LKKKRARSLVSPNRPQGHGLASACQSHKPQDPEKARGYAFLLLKFRLRSEKELALRLRQKKFSEAVIQETIHFLKEKEFIDDRVFAQGWVASRLKRPFGLRRIRQELALKGLDKEVIEEALERVKEHYSESEVISQLAEQRFSRLKDIEPQKAKARVYAYLMRRGFSPDTVGEIVNTL